MPEDNLKLVCKVHQQYHASIPKLNEEIYGPFFSARTSLSSPRGLHQIGELNHQNLAADYLILTARLSPSLPPLLCSAQISRSEWSRRQKSNPKPSISSCRI
ncbi:unnamed protein product [Cuscuta campestris]|uniref:Uncharacterized protein n=1 Tax=Cuscuta campestris TaxID=132261 RepID=A0A484N5F4_9ASTE|nr:unnamed protein product [Cuscuta campestris]